MKLAIAFLSAASVLAAAHSACAQRSATSKIDGAAYEAPYFYNTSDMYQQNAYDHARVLQEATSSGEPVPQPIAQEHTAGIRAGVQAARRNLTDLRETTNDNNAVAGHFDEIDRHHDKALALADEIDAVSRGVRADATAVNEHAKAIAEELKAAIDKHKQIADHLKTKQATN